MFKLIKTEEDFFYTCDFASKLYAYVESISGENRWIFNRAYNHCNGSYDVIFKSYDVYEYRNFILSIRAEPNEDDYIFKINKQVTELV